MANRYWVGGTASWDATAGTKWATTSGGAGGAAVPTSADDVFFDAASGTVTVTVASGNASRNLNFTGFTGTLAGSSSLSISGGLTLSSAMTWSGTGNLLFQAASGSYVITTSGKTLTTVSTMNLGSSGSSTAIWTLGDALTGGAMGITVTSGTFTTNNYNVTASSLSSSNSNTRTINLGSSTVTLSASGVGVMAFATSTNLTFNAGTSQINLTSASNPGLSAGSIAGSGITFYNVAFTTANAASCTLNGQPCTFNNLSFAGRTSAGITNVSIQADQIINGTLTLSAGTNATMRTFVRSNTIGTPRTLTCAAVALPTDIDFRDITIAGAAAPVSGTRLGDCKGNSGITFDAPKTVYYRSTGPTNWGDSIARWSFTNGGTADFAAFPLAQDTAVFPSSPTPYPSSGSSVTINTAFNIGTIDMSARTSNTMTLATGTTSPAIYGNWINGTGTTLTGTGTLTFAGRGSQTITSAGKTWTQTFTINSPGGSVTFQDAYTGNRSASNALELIAGTLDANDYAVTLSGSTSGFKGDGNLTRTLALGSGTWTIAGSGNVFDCDPSTNLTVTGTGTISLTSASAKNFLGGGIQTFPTLNQGGSGTLGVFASNKFAAITNTAIGRVQFSGGTTNEFGAFNLNGVLGNLLQVGSTNTTQAILKAPSWNVGLLSTDAGNNTGLSFTGVSPNYLSISYINGQISAAPITSYLGNFFAFF